MDFVQSLVLRYGSTCSFNGARQHYTTENIIFIISLLVCSDNIRQHFTVPKTEITAEGKY